jgi:enoyl-CoA hydratase/carnithine racemase
MELTRDGPVFILRMTDGENRLNRSFVDGFSRALDEVEASVGEAALVTTGADRFYCTGLDLEWIASGAERPGVFIADVQRLFARLLVFPVATVAAINGHAFAGGCLLALAHDFRVMRADRGFICMPEVDLRMGRPLTPGMYALLEARLSRATVHESLVTGRRYNAHEALARQFVHEIAPEDGVLPRAVEIARGLAAKDRASLGAIKRGLFGQALEALTQPLPDWLASPE